MFKISQGTYAFLLKLLNRANEKSTVYGYAMCLASLFASKYQGDFAMGAQIASGAVAVALFFLNDAQVRYLLTGQKPAQLPPVSMPQDKPESSQG